MSQSSLLIFLADLVLITHVLFVLFIVIGMIATYLGYYLNWHWIRNRQFRIIHVLAISVVVVQSLTGAVCPLTLWEMELRENAGVTTYSGSFIQYWLHRFLYYSAPEWVFTVVYAGVGGLVLASWFLVRPQPAVAK